MTAPADRTRSLALGPDGRLTNRAFLDDPALKAVLAVLNQDGDEARVVGGAVRNTLLDLPLADIDVATTALPETVIGRAKAARLRSIPTGIAHGTVTLLAGGKPFEITTLRQDIATDGRHAVVRFGRDFKADAQRRDFTINALSVSADGTVHDTTGGLADLVAGRVRFIGEADRRIREDYLRILRFFRFHATYGTGPPDPESLAASTLHRDSLARLSRERIRAEILKLLVAPGAAATVHAMDEAGIAAIALGGACRPERLARLATIEAGRRSGPDAILRLAALCVATSADADRLRAALRLSNGEHQRLAAAAEARSRLRPDAPPGREALLALLFACGREAARDGVSLAEADAPERLGAAWGEAFALLGEEPEPKLPVGGADIMARGVRNGRTVGAVLKRLQAAWIRAGFPKQPSVLASLLDEAIAAETREEDEAGGPSFPVT